MLEPVRQLPNLTYQSVSRLVGSSYRGRPFADIDSGIAYYDVGSNMG